MISYVMVISVQSFAQLYSLLPQRKLLKICTILALRFIFGFMQALVGSIDNLVSCYLEMTLTRILACESWCLRGC